MTSEASSERRIISERQAAKLLRLSQPTLRRWRADGRGPPIMLSPRRIGCRLSDLEQWFDERAVAAPGVGPMLELEH